MIFLSIVIVLAAIRLAIGVQLFRTAQRNNMPNLYWLSAVFIADFIQLCFVDLGNNPLGKLPFSYVVVSGAPIVLNALLIQFVHTTFYEGKSSPYRWIFAFHGLFSLAGLYGLSMSNSFANPSPWLIGFYISSLMVWGWHTMAAYTAYRSIAADAHVENWVKARYRWIIAYGLVEFGAAIATIARVVFANSSDALLNGLEGLLALANFVTIGLQIVVWLTPGVLKRFSNRPQGSSARVETSSEPFSALSVFGSAMAEGTSLKSMACFYAIRTTVEKRSGIEDSATLREYIKKMPYNEWEAVFQHSELRRILTNSGADNATTEHAIANARQALIEKQSLLTFSAH